ncbi:isochorismate synthase [Bacillus xiapuensis]|uniref:isochorismate synthase n=1 Tax=Bacillus xiapuensis TaxID=2014075 RepID=UPI001E327D17|nr:isochorismate synthase [Bacillus xiapuensis]
MSTIKSHPIKEVFIHALNRKSNDTQSMLFSYVEKVERVNPFTFYQNGKAVYAGERFFWKDRDGEMTIVGLGNIHIIRSEQKNRLRYEEVEQKWEALVDHSSIHNPFDGYGTGPLLFGGFSFDPQQQQEREWSNYSPAFFYVPEFMLTVMDGESYLTTNLMCTPYDTDDLIDHIERKKIRLFHETDASSANAGDRFSGMVEQDTNAWKQAVDQVVKSIKQDSKLKKVVLARKITADFDGDLSSDHVLERLLSQQPESFIFSLENMESCFLGASPERLVRKRNQVVLSTCLAGSSKRGQTKAEDENLGEKLLNDRKNRVEHDYVVQMIRREMSALCEDVDVPSTPTLMKVRDIQHLYTPVIGYTNEDSILPFVEKLHPTPALGGLPNDKALREIRRLEMMDRGFYGAPVGWMDYRKNGEFAVAIRSGLLHKQRAVLYAGCGVVENSDPESEFIETGIKFRPMLRAIGGSADE